MAQPTADRALGNNDRKAKITAPNKTIWMVTANNLQVGAEIARRTCRIRLDAKTSRPEKRTGFKRADADLIAWALANRGEVIARLLVMVRAWFVDGRPSAAMTPFGMFTPWATTAGGILQFAGVAGFLANTELFQAEANEEAAEWEGFLTMWGRLFGHKQVTARDVAREFIMPDFSGWLPDDLGRDYRVEDEGRSFAKRLGRALARKAGTRFGERQLHIRRCEEPDLHLKVARWELGGDLAGFVTAPDEPLKSH